MADGSPMMTRGAGGGPPHPWHTRALPVTVLAPAGTPGTFPDFLDTTLAAVNTPFTEERCETLNLLSAAFLKDPVLRRDPASVAVAYWMRRAQTARLKERFERRAQDDSGVVRVPVGRVFHVAPSNVDTLFIYSWALAFLCGNANVVRLSQERDAVVEAMLAAIGDLARERAELRDQNRFVTYAHDEEITATLSAWCSHRVIWGGNETIEALRPLHLNPHASERLFGSKFSYAVFRADSLLAADGDARARLAAAFFNDLFWFDQMACSSPHIVFWVGDEDQARRAMAVLEEDLQREVERRTYAPSASNAMRRLAYAFDLAADADVRVGLSHPGFIGIEARDRAALGRELCGGGLVRHFRLERLEEVADFAAESDQTITHFGFAPDELKAFAARVGARGVDRIVPIGEALAFDVVWDGHDLVGDFVRNVAVRT